MQEKVLIATIGLSHKFRDDIATIKSIEAVPSILQAVCQGTVYGKFRCVFAAEISRDVKIKTYRHLTNR